MELTRRRQVLAGPSLYAMRPLLIALVVVTLAGVVTVVTLAVLAGPHATQSTLSSFTVVWASAIGFGAIAGVTVALVTIRSHDELSAGYTTTPFAYPEVHLVDARTGIVLRPAGSPLIDKNTFQSRRAQARQMTATPETGPSVAASLAVEPSDAAPPELQARELHVDAPLPFKVLNSQPHRLVLLAIFLGAVVLFAIFGVAAASLTPNAYDRQRAIMPIVIAAIALIMLALLFFGLLTRSESRNRLLEQRFPDSFVETIGKTDDLSVQLVILNGPTQQTGVPADTLATYSSLVVDTSGIAIWTGSASNPTRTFALPASAVREISAAQGAGGPFLRVVVEKNSVPLTLMLRTVRLGLVRFSPMSPVEVEILAKRTQAKLGG